jgi:secondary thiamine-phosphate synthase enzyme
MKTITVQTKSRTAFLDITETVQQVVDSVALRDGLVTVFVPHTTAGITINEKADPDVLVDLETALDRLAPWTGGYRHAEGNSAAHIKTLLTGSSVQVLVESGRLQLGTWQSLFFCEFDGPRTRTIWIKESA